MKLFTKILLHVFVISYSLAIEAQTNDALLIEGFVVDTKTSKPIPFANIGILNTEVGTLSNENGSFSISIPAKYENYNLLFSSIGYDKKSFQINSIDKSSPFLVSLDELIIELDEVVVSSKKIKKQKVTLGNGKSLLPQGRFRADPRYAGSAFALLIDKSQYPDLTYLQNASLYIAINKMPSFKIRMRLLAVDSTNGSKPGNDILQEQIIEQSTMTRGWLDFPLQKVNQIEQNAFYLTFEWIFDKSDREYIVKEWLKFDSLYSDRILYDTIMVDGNKLVNKNYPELVAGTAFGVTASKKDRSRFVCYSRGNSFGEWDRSPNILSAKIEMSNYPLEPNKNEETSRPISITDSITRWVEKLQEGHNISGLQLAVKKQDKIVYSNAFGYADRINRIKATPTTQFRIASVSKTMTSAGLMKLVSQGKIDLDESVHVYVPSFPQKKYPITIRQLLSHLGGIRDYYGISWEDELFIQEHYKSSTEALSIFEEDSLVVKPGAKFVYSSFGYILLGAVIESVTGQSYIEYMHNEVWKPLNMNLTYSDVADSAMVNKSKFYFLSGEESTPYDLSYKYSSGGLVSSAEDLVNFSSSLVNEKLFDKPLLNQMFKTQITTKGEPIGYGLGWYVGEDNYDKKVWYHAGETPEASSMLLIYPELGIVIALLSNSPIISYEEDGFSK